MASIIIKILAAIAAVMAGPIGVVIMIIWLIVDLFLLS